MFRSCNGGSSPTIYNTAAPLGNGSDPENNRSAQIHMYNIIIYCFRIILLTRMFNHTLDPC
jgi:hypothetical protein